VCGTGIAAYTPRILERSSRDVLLEPLVHAAVCMKSYSGGHVIRSSELSLIVASCDLVRRREGHITSQDFVSAAMSRL